MPSLSIDPKPEPEPIPSSNSNSDPFMSRGEGIPLDRNADEEFDVAFGELDDQLARR